MGCAGLSYEVAGCRCQACIVVTAWGLGLYGRGVRRGVGSSRVPVPWYRGIRASPSRRCRTSMFFSGTSRFRPIRLLGTGGMGSVHLVYGEQLGTEVALKTLKLSSGTDLYRFTREFRTLADVKHTNLVTLYELISEGPLWFFTMEYVPGLPFDQFLLGARNSSTVDAAGMHFDSDCLLQTVQQLCVGVHAMHEAGCIHRDIKPTHS